MEWSLNMWQRLTAAHPCLPGHFPGEPIAPGVLVMDFVIQALKKQAGRQLSVQGVPMVKFIQPLRPETAFVIQFESLAESLLKGKVKFQVIGEDQQVFSSGQLSVVVTE